MNNYLKKFENHSQYESFVGGGTMVRPNVSYCVEQNEVHYNPVPIIMTVKYNVTDATNPTQLYTYVPQEGMTVNGALMFDKVEIDGTEVSIADLDAASGQTQFSVGEHTAKYTLKDPTIIGLELNEQFPPTITKANASFLNCSSLTSVTIPNSVTNIGQGAFNGCTSLTNITIPDSVTSIGQGAFNGCTSLTNITIPDSVTSIGDVVFQNCSNLTNIVIPNSVTNIGTYAFNGCTGLTSIDIPNSITSIGDETFRGCTGLTSITIPNSVTLIDTCAFEDCSSLTSVTIPNSVTSISLAAFKNCTSLTSVTIGDGVTEIAQGAFKGCSNLASITSLATTAPTIGIETFRGIKTNGTLTVASGSNGYDVWMGTGYYYLGLYGWTMVEQ